MVLPLYLRQQFVDIVKTPAGFQPHLMGSGLIGSDSGRLLNGFKPGANRLIDHLPEGSVKLLCNRSSSVQNIVIYSQCRSHVGILASFYMMSRHQLSLANTTHAAPPVIFSLTPIRGPRAGN